MYSKQMILQVSVYMLENTHTCFVLKVYKMLFNRKLYWIVYFCAIRYILCNSTLQMFKVLVIFGVLTVALGAPAPAPQAALPPVPGLEKFLAELAKHAEQEAQVNAAAALFPPNPSPGVVGPGGAIGPSGIVGSSGNIGPSGLCGPSGCVAFGR